MIDRRLLGGAVGLVPSAASLLAAAALGGCSAEEFGAEPPTARFHFPVGLVTDYHVAPNDNGVPTEQGGQRLFVVSSNFNLEFKSGTVSEVDLAKFGQAFARDGSITQQELFYAEAIESESAVKIPSFGGQATYVPDPEQPGRGELITVTREAWEIIRISVNATDASDTTRRLSCDDDPSLGLRSCDNTIDDVTFRRQLEAFDPFAVASAELTLPDAPGSTTFDTARYIFVGHLLNGEVLILRQDTLSTVACLRNHNDPAERNLVANALALLEHDTGGQTLMVGFRDEQILRYADPGVIVSGSPAFEDCPDPALEQIADTAPITLGLDAFAEFPAEGSRALVPHPDGQLLYVVTRGPDGLAVFDVGDGIARNRWRAVDFIPLKGQPANAVFARNVGPGGRDIIYVVTSDADRLIGIDALTREVIVDIPQVVRSPYGLVANARIPLGDPDSAATEVMPALIVAGFQSSELAVIDLRAAPAEQAVVARIGEPR